MAHRPVRVAIHVNSKPHQRAHGEAMRAGLARHGIQADFASYDEPRPCDVAVVWGWKQSRVIESGARILCMERGHLQDRMVYASLGWDGLGNRGRYPKAPDGERWERLFGRLLEPWKDGTHVVVFGQCPGDAALTGMASSFQAWAQRVVDEARGFGLPIIYRPHPVILQRGDTWHPNGASLSELSLRQDIERAAIAITYNSTSGVECVLAGAPTITLDEGAMAWPVSAHEILVPPMPDRTAWCHDMAYTNWTIDEIADGTAWELLRTVIDEP